MNSIVRQRNFRFTLYAFAILGFAAVIYGGSAIFNGLITTAHAQTDPFLDRRISQIEQRFTLLESRINRLEQDSRSAGRITPESTSGSEIEIRLLRAQIEALQIRLAETECALLRLDERTLSETARQARRKSPPGVADRCRANPNAPIQLSAQP